MFCAELTSGPLRASRADNFRYWPLADGLAAGPDVRFQGVKQTCRLGQGMSSIDPQRT